VDSQRTLNLLEAIDKLSELSPILLFGSSILYEAATRSPITRFPFGPIRGALRGGKARRGKPPKDPDQEMLNRPAFERRNLPVAVGEVRRKTAEQLRKEAKRAFYRRLATGGILVSTPAILKSSSILREGPGVLTGTAGTIPEIVVTPKARTPLSPTKKPTPSPSSPPKVTVGTIRKLFPWISAAILAPLFRPKIRVVTPSGAVRTAETLSDIPLPTNVAVPLLTGFPLTQTQPRLVRSTRDCQIVQRRRRRKGKCREGFFRETARGTKYITWRTKKCR